MALASSEHFRMLILVVLTTIVINYIFFSLRHNREHIVLLVQKHESLLSRNEELRSLLNDTVQHIATANHVVRSLTSTPPQLLEDIIPPQIDVVVLQPGQGLKYFLRSVEEFAPWIRRIFFVVPKSSTVPHWVDRNHPRISIFVEDELESSAAALPRNHRFPLAFILPFLPGLADQFLLFDHPILFTRQVFLDQLTHPTHGDILYLERDELPPSSATVRLFESRFGDAFSTVSRQPPTAEAPMVFRKSILYELFLQFRSTLASSPNVAANFSPMAAYVWYLALHLNHNVSHAAKQTTIDSTALQRNVVDIIDTFIDRNHDGKIDEDDLAVLAARIATSTPVPEKLLRDLDYSLRYAHLEGDPTNSAVHERGPLPFSAVLNDQTTVLALLWTYYRYRFETGSVSKDVASLNSMLKSATSDETRKPLADVVERLLTVFDTPGARAASGRESAATHQLGPLTLDKLVDTRPKYLSWKDTQSTPVEIQEAMETVFPQRSSFEL